VAAPAPAPVPAPVVAPKANLDEVLKAAGLTMAVTNPAKLQAVQEAVVTAPAARPVRQRKPVAVEPEAPLVQIETQR
jgi:ribonuclease E